MRWSRLPIVAALAFLALVPRGATAADPVPYPITVILPLTGPGAFIGQTHQKVLGILQGLVNKQGGIRGRPLQLNFLDDTSTPQTAVQLATRAIEAKPAVVFGSAIAGLCSATNPLYQNAKTLNWCFSPTYYPPVGGFSYPSLSGSKDLMRIQVKFMRERGIKRLALLSTTDVSGKTGQSELNEVFKEPGGSGVTLVADEVFAPTDVSTAAQLAKIKAQQPDALMIWASGAAVGTGLTGVRDAGMENMPIFAASSAMVWSQITGLTSVIPKTLYFVGFGFDATSGRNDASNRKLKAFQDAVTAAGIHIDGVTGLAWDGVAIVVDALRALGPDATSDQIRSWIASQKSYPGISGLYNFTKADDMHGLGIDDLLIVRWDQQKQAWLPASKFGGSLL